MFLNEVEASLLCNYFGNSNDLSWLNAAFGSTSFFKNKNKPVNTRFFTNPNATEKDMPSVYARLPGTLYLNDVEHCAPDNNSDAARVLKKAVFYGESVLGTKHASVCWLLRCSVAAFESFPADVFETIIAWVQRHEKANSHLEEN